MGGYVEAHQDTNIACVAGTGHKMDRARCHVDQPRNQMKWQGKSGDGLHMQAKQSGAEG
jgi:hypothetical protein